MARASIARRPGVGDRMIDPGVKRDQSDEHHKPDDQDRDGGRGRGVVQGQQIVDGHQPGGGSHYPQHSPHDRAVRGSGRTPGVRPGAPLSVTDTHRPQTSDPPVSLPDPATSTSSSEMSTAELGSPALAARREQQDRAHPDGDLVSAHSAPSPRQPSLRHRSARLRRDSPVVMYRGEVPRNRGDLILVRTLWRCRSAGAVRVEVVDLSAVSAGRWRAARAFVSTNSAPRSAPRVHGRRPPAA